MTLQPTSVRSLGVHLRALPYSTLYSSTPGKPTSERQYSHFCMPNSSREAIFAGAFPAKESIARTKRSCCQLLFHLPLRAHGGSKLTLPHQSQPSLG